MNFKELNQIPAPNSYTSPSMLEKKSASMKSRHPDVNLKSILSVFYH